MEKARETKRTTRTNLRRPDILSLRRASPAAGQWKETTLSGGECIARKRPEIYRNSWGQSRNRPHRRASAAVISWPRISGSAWILHRESEDLNAPDDGSWPAQWTSAPDAVLDFSAPSRRPRRALVLEVLPAPSLPPGDPGPRRRLHLGFRPYPPDSR